nr:hypothetical protein [Tanacetum cinerariifolium]
YEDSKKLAWVKWSNILASPDKVGPMFLSFSSCGDSDLQFQSWHASKEKRTALAPSLLLSVGPYRDSEIISLSTLIL